jgi:hypothetical protein
MLPRNQLQVVSEIIDYYASFWENHPHLSLTISLVSGAVTIECIKVWFQTMGDSNYSVAIWGIATVTSLLFTGLSLEVTAMGLERTKQKTPT